ncbi:MAG: hypothetical protein HY738_13335 [Bacteroidia bacterium]|nr:hypothetical protein [Bacteroidia bacterium]
MIFGGDANGNNYRSLSTTTIYEGSPTVNTNTSITSHVESGSYKWTFEKVK